MHSLLLFLIQHSLKAWRSQTSSVHFQPWNCSTIFWFSFLAIAKPLPIFASERLCFSKVLFFLLSHVTEMFPVNIISCNMFLQLFKCHLLFQPFVAPDPDFFYILLPSNWKWHFTWKLLIYSYILLWIKYWFMRFANHRILFLFTFYMVFWTLWNGGCIILQSIHFHNQHFNVNIYCH